MHAICWISALTVTSATAATAVGYTLDGLDRDYTAWKKTYEVAYATSEEDFYRRWVFKKNAAAIHARNAEQTLVQLAVNRFADRTPEEFAAHYLSGYTGRKGLLAHAAPVDVERGDADLTDIPAFVDWTLKGAVTPVKNQGQCGSCWAFSTTGSVEGAWFLKTGTLVSLSEQQLVDCSVPEGNAGCSGGLMNQAFDYIVTNGGLCSESAYPYTAANGTCDTCTPVAHIRGHVDVQPNNETAMMEAVAQQPVSVAVEADGLDWQFYFGGIVTDSCGTNLDHGVLVVGYGVAENSNQQAYWKVKNSWGADWGEEGYIRLGRGAAFAPHGECGILMDPSYPVV